MKRNQVCLLLGLVVLLTVTAIPGCGSMGRKAAANEKADPKTFKAAPEVTFKGLDGKEVSLASLKGKVVVVNFWATWCEPCQIEIPWMIEFQNKYAGKGFTIIGAAMDDEGASVVAPYVEKEKFDVDGQKLPINYPVVLGNDDIGEKFGGILGLPTSFVITRDGKIAKHIMGLVNHDDLEGAIQSNL
jgi:thiol-disulfide isomerase/thioredoxin